MNNGTQRHVLQLKCISQFRSYSITTNDSSTNLQSLWSKDVSLFAVSINYQSDKSTTVWIVLDSFNRCRDILLVPLKIYNTIHFFMTATEVTHASASLGIAACSVVYFFKQAFF